MVFSQVKKKTSRGKLAHQKKKKKKKKNDKIFNSLSVIYADVYNYLFSSLIFSL